VTKPRGKEDGEIAKFDSTPPEAEDAYGAPTKVGEAAYQMLASGMAAFDAPVESQKPSSKTKPKPSPVAVVDDAIAKVTDDADVDERAGTLVIPAGNAQPLANPSPQPIAPPETRTSSISRWRIEIIVGVIAFFVILAPALIYILTR
jgi:hypothetical protein